MDGTLTLAVFMASALLVTYPYVLYPALLSLIAQFRPAPRPPAGELPSVSVIIAAYNEETWIARKLESTLSQNYPADRLEAIVVSDGSTDGTAEVVAGFGDARARLVAQRERSGKSAALNAGVRAARGSVLVFTDANALFAPEAIRRLAEYFTDPRVGLVSGQGLYGAMEDSTALIVANSYVRLEALIKRGEGALGFIGAADGAIYALRRALYQELPPNHVDDLHHPILAALAGYSCRFDPLACTVEPPSRGAGQELQRHARIIAQGYTILVSAFPRLVAGRRWRELWVLGSHRLLRWISALGLAGLLATSVVGHGRLFTVALAGQGLLYATSVFGWLAERAGWRLGLLAAPYYFCVVSAGGALGLLSYLRGNVQVIWAPRGIKLPRGGSGAFRA